MTDASPLDRLGPLLDRYSSQDARAALAAALVRQPAPDPLDAQIDSAQGLLARHRERLHATLTADVLAVLEVAASSGTAGDGDLAPAAHPLTPSAAPRRDDVWHDDDTLDALARDLLARPALSPDDAAQLAVALGRLVEDAPRLKLGRAVPLGGGFEPLLDDRLTRRVQILDGCPRLLGLLRQHGALLLEEPTTALLAIERGLGRPLDAEERAWLDLERRIATLRFVRRGKTDHDGHIRWYVRRDAQHGAVLDRLGTSGHWLVVGPASQIARARLATAVERVVGASGTPGWNVVRLDEAAPDCASRVVGEALPISAVVTLPAALVDEADLTRLRAAVREALTADSASSRGEQPATPDTTAVVSAIAAALAQTPADWRPDAVRPSVYRFVLEADDRGVWIGAPDRQGTGPRAPAEPSREPLARVSLDPSDDDLLDFLECVARLADLSLPVDGIPARLAAEPVVQWVRALLRGVARTTCEPDCHPERPSTPVAGDILPRGISRSGARLHEIPRLRSQARSARDDNGGRPTGPARDDNGGGDYPSTAHGGPWVVSDGRGPARGRGPHRAGERVRLVYVPSSIPHLRGGFPEVGLAFVRDRLERAGAWVDGLTLTPEDMERRLVELLGADIVAIGVYIHNRREVAELVTMLRQAGFRGRIVLGGPETRDIDSVQTLVDGWDVAVRGEAEEALPAALDVLDLLDAGAWDEGLARALNLRGTLLRHGEAVLLCDTAVRNRASEILCPLPFDWGRRRDRRYLKMNFTRGCPYRCDFCPNHQGRRFRSGEVSELWRYTVLAVADDLPLPDEVNAAVAREIQAGLGVQAPPRLRVALSLLVRAGPTRDRLATVVAALGAAVDARLLEDGDLLAAQIGLRETVMGRLASWDQEQPTAWQTRELWLLVKAAVLATRNLRRGLPGGATPSPSAPLPQGERGASGPFVLETAEDNTLVNRAQIAEYLACRQRFGLADDVIFNPGQNTIRDLLRAHWGDEADAEFVAVLADGNRFSVALGADGTSNTILRQNRKPFYGVAGILAVNRELGRYDLDEIANNYILLTPESSLLDAVESFLLFLLLPVPWRNYGPNINLRVVKDDTTLATDEGLLYDPREGPDDLGYVPLRDPAVQALLDRWSLTSMVSTAEIRPLLRRLLAEDAEAAAMLPLVVERWRRNAEGDSEIAALARLVERERRPNEPLSETLPRLETEIQARGLVDGRTVATFRELAGYRGRGRSHRPVV